MPAPDLAFHFDPLCPWTWMTSRWLADAAPRRDASVTWRPLSLLVLNDGEPPEQYADGLRVSARVLRVIAALGAEGRNDLAGAVYERVGTLTFQAGADLTADVAARAVADAGASDWLPALDDVSLDDPVARSTREALALAGPDVGTPVLAFGDPRVGFSGPIVSPGPRGEDGARLLDLVLASGAVPGFFELKRGRSEPPALPAPPWG
jgi:hypothetical protein